MEKDHISNLGSHVTIFKLYFFCKSKIITFCVSPRHDQCYTELDRVPLIDEALSNCPLVVMVMWLQFFCTARGPCGIKTGLKMTQICVLCLCS